MSNEIPSSIAGIAIQKLQEFLKNKKSSTKEYARQEKQLVLKEAKVGNKTSSTKEDAHKEKLSALELAKSKEIIDVKEFKLLYGFSDSAQKGFRSRLNNPISFIQKNFKSKIMYNKSEVDKWFEGKKG